MKEKRDAFLIGLIALFFFLSAYIFDIYHDGLIETGKTFGVSYMTMNNPFYTVIQNEFEKQVEGREDRMVLRDPSLDADRQIEQIEEFIEMDVDGIFINPVDSATIIPALRKAQEARIPVIVIDSPLKASDAISASVVSDNYEAGKLCALDLMAARKSARIALLRHSDVISGTDRIQGFLDTIAGHPELKWSMRRNVPDRPKRRCRPWWKCLRGILKSIP